MKKINVKAMNRVKEIFGDKGLIMSFSKDEPSELTKEGFEALEYNVIGEVMNKINVKTLKKVSEMFGEETDNDRYLYSQRMRAIGAFKYSSINAVIFGREYGRLGSSEWKRWV